MAITTYSFLDVSVSISHPNVGTYSAVGEGIGSIAISRSNDVSAQDVSGDGSVMVSKIRARNGSISFTIQQTSGFNRWLNKWYNYLEGANTSVWADTKIIVRAPQMGKVTTLIGVSPQKFADEPYQAQGQNLTWALLAADIQTDPI
jgi:glutamine cyclotransferase